MIPSKEEAKRATRDVGEKLKAGIPSVEDTRNIG